MEGTFFVYGYPSGLHHPSLDGKLLVMTPIDPAFLLIHLLQFTLPVCCP